MRRDRTHALRADELVRFDRIAVSDTSVRMIEHLCQRPIAPPIPLLREIN